MKIVSRILLAALATCAAVTLGVGNAAAAEQGPATQVTAQPDRSIEWP
ncbi:hypothetical protein [Streptomyces sp. NPDC005349]